jgi:hypothetical protein
MKPVRSTMVLVSCVGSKPKKRVAMAASFTQFFKAAYCHLAGQRASWMAPITDWQPLGLMHI